MSSFLLDLAASMRFLSSPRLPQLPLEVVLLILELAAQNAVNEHRPHRAASLCLVCSAARATLEPILYHHVHLDQYNVFCISAANARFAAHTRSIFVSPDIGPGLLQRTELVRALARVEVCVGHPLALHALASFVRARTVVFTHTLTAWPVFVQELAATTLSATTRLYLPVHERMSARALQPLAALGLTHAVLDVRGPLPPANAAAGLARLFLCMPRLQRLVWRTTAQQCILHDALADQADARIFVDAGPSLWDDDDDAGKITDVSDDVVWTAGRQLFTHDH